MYFWLLGYKSNLRFCDLDFCQAEVISTKKVLFSLGLCLCQLTNRFLLFLLRYGLLLNGFELLRLDTG